MSRPGTRAAIAPPFLFPAKLRSLLATALALALALAQASAEVPCAQVWQLAETPVGTDLLGVAGSPAGTWVAVGTRASGLGGKLGESEDGIAWRPLPSPASRNLLALAAGRDGVVAVGEGGTVVAGGCPFPRPVRHRLPAAHAAWGSPPSTRLPAR